MNTVKIAIVCSVHREIGRCNAFELLKVLQELKPDVMFEEVAPTMFDLAGR